MSAEMAQIEAQTNCSQGETKLNQAATKMKEVVIFEAKLSSRHWFVLKQVAVVMVSAAKKGPKKERSSCSVLACM